MRLFLATLLLVALFGCAPRSEDGSHLRLGYMARLTHAPALTGLESGRFETALSPVTVEAHAFEVGNTVIEAMFAGEIDAAYLGPNPAINGFVRSGGRDVRILAGATEGGSGLVVRRAAGIRSPADLTGKRLATPQIANTQDIALRRYLREHGLASTLAGGSVTVLPLSSAILRSLFEQGEIDGAWVSEPLLSELVQRPDADLFVDEATRWPDGRYPTTLLAVRKPYLDAHPEVVARLVRAHVGEVKWLEGHRDAGLALARTAMRARADRRLPDPLAQSAWRRLRFDADPLMPALTAAARAAEQEDFLPKSSLDGLVLREPLALARAAP